MRAAEWSHIGLSNGSRRRRSRSGSISPSEPRAPFVCQRPGGPKWPGEGCCSSTTCSPRARPSAPAHAHCCGRAPPASTCWCSPGLWRGPALQYKAIDKFSLRIMIEIYTTRHCPYCHAAKRLLSRKGVEFSEVDVSGDPKRRSDMVARANGRTTVPQIFVGSTHVGGYDDLFALDRVGKLDLLLGRDDPLAGAGERPSA